MIIIHKAITLRSFYRPSQPSLLATPLLPRVDLEAFTSIRHFHLQSPPMPAISTTTSPLPLSINYIRNNTANYIHNYIHQQHICYYTYTTILVSTIYTATTTSSSSSLITYAINSDSLHPSKCFVVATPSSLWPKSTILDIFGVSLMLGSWSLVLIWARSEVGLLFWFAVWFIVASSIETKAAESDPDNSLWDVIQ